MSEGWTPYLRSVLPDATDADRARVEAEIGQRLPEAYWALARVNQGRVPDPKHVTTPRGGRASIGVFLFLIERSRVERPGERSYGVLSAVQGLAGLCPEGIVPFSDDTGGNVMAFDYRGGAEPAVVFVDHETDGARGLAPVARDFAAFMAMRTP